MKNHSTYPASEPEAYDINTEVQHRINANPDGKQVLVNFSMRVPDVLFGLRDSEAIRLPEDGDYQRLSVSMTRWVDLTYIFVYETAHNSVRAKKVINPKNNFPGAELRFGGMVIEQHSVRRPYQFVTESESRVAHAKKNKRLSPDMFTSEAEFHAMELSVIVTYCIDSSGKPCIMMGVPNEDYTGWASRPFDLVKFLGLDGMLGGEVVPDVPEVTGPTVKLTKKEPKKKAINE